MAIIKRTVPYEILIRFGFGGDHQACQPGEFSGAHYRTADLLTDDATGELVASPVVGHAQEVPQDKLAALVGSEMAAINAGVASLKAELLAAQELAAARAQTIADQAVAIQAGRNHAEEQDKTMKEQAAAIAAANARIEQLEAGAGRASTAG